MSLFKFYWLFFKTNVQKFIGEIICSYKQEHVFKLPENVPPDISCERCGVYMRDVLPDDVLQEFGWQKNSSKTTQE